MTLSFRSIVGPLKYNSSVQCSASVKVMVESASTVGRLDQVDENPRMLHSGMQERSNARSRMPAWSGMEWRRSIAARRRVDELSMRRLEVCSKKKPLKKGVFAFLSRDSYTFVISTSPRFFSYPMLEIEPELRHCL